MAVSVGDIITSKKDGDFEVIEKLSASKFRVRFVVTGYTTVSQYTKVSRGEVRDYLKPSKFGVGYLGEMAGKTNKSLTSYKTWHNMLTRCYYKPYQKRFPTYLGCSVCDEWLNFSNFHKWFEVNYEQGLVLDKDIIKDGNKVYCPEYCKFVTAEENCLKATESSRKSYEVMSPTGDKIVIDNVNKFCRELGVSQGTFLMMLNGDRNIAWGWTLIRKLED